VDPPDPFVAKVWQHARKSAMELRGERSMALVDPAVFDGKDVTMVYIAGRLSESKQVEQVLSDHDIDYAVDIEPFENRVLGFLRVEYEGVGFYVASSQAELSRRLLRDAGLLQGLVEDDPE
jgi:hypothetical protein